MKGNVNDLRRCECGCGQPINVEFFKVLDLWGPGVSDAEIAKRLGMSVKYVRTTLTTSWWSLPRRALVHTPVTNTEPMAEIIERSSLGKKKTHKRDAAQREAVSAIATGKIRHGVYCSIGEHAKCSIPDKCRCDCHKV